MGGVGARDVHACEAQPFLDLAFERVLESVGVIMQARAKHAPNCSARGTRNATPRDENPARPARRCIPAIQMFFSARPPPRARASKGTTQILEPGHAHAFEAAVERPRNLGSLIESGRGNPAPRSCSARRQDRPPNARHPGVFSVDHANAAFGFGTQPEGWMAGIRRHCRMRRDYTSRIGATDHRREAASKRNGAAASRSAARS